MAYYTFTEDQYKSMPSAQSSSLGIKKAKDGTYYTTKSAATKFGGVQTDSLPGSSSSSSTSSSPSGSSNNTAYYYNGKRYSSMAEIEAVKKAESKPTESVDDTVARAKAMLGDAYDPNTPVPTAERLDEIANQDFITPENKAAYETTKLAPVNQNYLAELSKTKIPTTADAIQSPYQGYLAPSPTSSFGNISAPTAGTAGLQSMAEYSMSNYQAQLDRLNQQNESNQNAFQQLLASMTSPSEARQQAQEETGIDVAEHFAQQEAGFKEIEVLTNEYNKTIEMKDQQIAMTHDKMDSNNFINNQIAQIERNAAPKLNRLSADINAKAAVMQAQQGNFAEAQKYVNQAVQDAVAENKYNADMFAMAFDINQDAFDRVETIYADAYKEQMAFAQAEYQQQLSEKETIGKLFLEYPNAGIDIYADDLQTAMQKAGVRAGDLEMMALTSGGSGVSLTADMKNYQFAVQTGYEGSFADFLGKGGASQQDQIDGLTVSLYNGEIGISEVPSDLRNQVLNAYHAMQEIAAQQAEEEAKKASGPTQKYIAPATPGSTSAYNYTGPKEQTATSSPVQFGVPETDGIYNLLFSD